MPDIPAECLDALEQGTQGENSEEYDWINFPFLPTEC